MNTPSFHIDLTDTNASGVYQVGPQDIATLDTEATRDGFNVHHVDLAGCIDQATLTRRMAKGFSLPQSYADDWPAIVAYLQRMDAIPSRGHVVLLRHSQALHDAAAATMDELLDMLEDTAAIWAGEGVTFFVFTQLPAHADADSPATA